MPITLKKKGGASSESLKVLDGLKKHYGDQVGTMGDGYAPIGRVASGIFPLDLAIGGGFPIWRTSMLFGPESSSKTAVGLRLLGSVQRANRTAVLIDSEHVYDAKWTEKFGVNTKDLIVIQPDNAEQSVDAAEGMMNADDVGIVLLDSLATMQPQKWIDAEAGKANVGGNTQIISSLYTKVGSALTKQQRRGNPIMFVVINQIRSKVGVMFGDPETTPGGFQPRFASSMTIRFYGKKVHEDKHHKDMPTHMLVSGVVRKWRVPIIGTSFEYKLCLADHEGYNVGQVMDTWKTVAHRLQASEDLAKDGKLWNCMGVEAPTLDQLEERYRNDLAWQLKLQKRVFEVSDVIKPPKAKQT